MKKIFQNKFLVFILLIILFIAIRSLHFVPALNFSFDQGNGFTRILEMWKNKEITLVGPGSSISADNKLLLQGSILYYFTLIFAVPGKFDPIVSSYIFMIFSSFGIIPLYSGMKKLANQKAALLMVILYTLLPMFIDYTRFFFGPSFLIPLSTILIYLMGIYKVKPKNIYLFFIFAYTGILMQFHYQVVIVLILLFFYYLLKLHIRKHWIPASAGMTILIMIGGFCVGFSPMILFELKNQFY
ncbi:MAG: glycosyltransferase family 39 protein, partial [Patescibacteria group bacterium]